MPRGRRRERIGIGFARRLRSLRRRRRLGRRCRLLRLRAHGMRASDAARSRAAPVRPPRGVSRGAVGVLRSRGSARGSLRGGPTSRSKPNAASAATPASASSCLREPGAGAIVTPSARLAASLRFGLEDRAPSQGLHVLEHHTVARCRAAARALAAALMLAARLCLRAAARRALARERPADHRRRCWRATSSRFVIAARVCARGSVPRASRASAGVEAGSLVVERAGRRVEVPCASIAGVTPWRLPLPSPGAHARTRARARASPRASRCRIRRACSTASPTRGSPRRATAHRAARRSLRRGARRLAAPLVRAAPGARSLLFSLLPAAVGFYAHQHIAFGALLGEYYLMGRGAPGCAPPPSTG